MKPVRRSNAASYGAVVRMVVWQWLSKAGRRLKSVVLESEMVSRENHVTKDSVAHFAIIITILTLSFISIG